MRIAVAAVLIPLAVAIAYAGGWLWAALVTLAAIGLFVEWLAIVGLAGATRVTVPGVAALAVAGLCFAIGRLDAALIVLGGRSRCGGRRSRRSGEAGRRRDFCMRRRPRSPRCWCVSIPSRDSPR